MKMRLAICAAIILAGLSLRAFGPGLGLPAFLVKYGGSVLWAVMVYFLVAAGQCDWPRWRIGAASMSIAIAVEAFRLYHVPWLDAFRLTLPGALLLGRIFSMWNILAYAIGVAVAAACDPRAEPGAKPTFSRAMFVLLWATAAGAIAIAVSLEDPLFLPYRNWALAAIIGASIAGVPASVFAMRRDEGVLREGRLLIALWCCVPLALASNWFWARLREHRVMSTPLELGQRYGRHFIVGYESVGEVAPLAARGLIGGIFITHRNAAGRSLDQLRDEIAQLQRLRRDAGLPPLIVVADQEGGIVSHLSPPLPAHAPLSDLAGLPPDVRRAKAREAGETLGAELVDLGVTVDFAPVVDLRFERWADASDNGSRIASRAIDADPAVVTDVATAFILGLQAKGVSATLKHFPGLGRVREDTHAMQARLAARAYDLAQSDWAPFREIVRQSPALVMASHAIIDAIDPQHPTSQSKAAISGLLRGEWGFDGLVVTDDLDMGAVYRHDICSGVVASLNAGVDLLLVSYDGRQYYPLMECVLAADAKGQIDRQMQAGSDARLHARRN
jgi:beta-N-acetylhexosaminidase